MNTGQVTYEIDLSPARTAAEEISRWASTILRRRATYNPPIWAGPHWQPIPSTFRKCAWCKDHLSVFGPPTADLGDGWAHTECVDKAERFALKASIRNRTNPATGYFPGWRTP